jgi:hypothetical protein
MRNTSLTKNVTIFLIILFALWFSGMILTIMGALMTGIVSGFFAILKLVFSKFGLAIIAAALLVYIFNQRGSSQPHWR